MSGRLQSPKAEELVSVAPEMYHRVAPEPHCGFALCSNSCRRSSTSLVRLFKHEVSVYIREESKQCVIVLCVSPWRPRRSRSHRLWWWRASWTAGVARRECSAATLCLQSASGESLGNAFKSWSLESQHQTISSALSLRVPPTPGWESFPRPNLELSPEELKWWSTQKRLAHTRGSSMAAQGTCVRWSLLPTLALVRCYFNGVVE